MQLFRACVLVVVGIIHLFPVAGVLGFEALEKLYGLKLDDASTLLLMRHRAALFGILSIVMIYSAFKPNLHELGLLVGIASIISFIVLASLSQEVNEAIHKVYRIDQFALLLLIGAITTLFVKK